MGYHLRDEAAAVPLAEACETGRVLTGFGNVGSGYRYYSSELGRWVSRDPIGEEGGENMRVIICLLLFVLVGCSSDKTAEQVRHVVNDGDLDALRMYLHLGHSPDVAGGGGDTLLMIAARRNHMHIAYSLITASAHIDARDDRGVTALMWAAMSGHHILCAHLINSGAQVNLADAQGLTALHHAARKGHAEVVDVLIAHDADSNLRDESGATPLHRAVSVAVSVRNSLDNEKRENFGVRVMETVRLLLQGGSDPTVRTGDGRTAIDLSREHNDEELSVILEDALGSGVGATLENRVIGEDQE